MAAAADGPNLQTYSLVRDAEQWWGHRPTGETFERNDYESRYILPPLPGAVYGLDYYPPNDGAVRGSRVHYSSISAAIRDYGATVDRIGPESGSVLTLRVDGVASFFDERSLPVTAMWERYHAYLLSAEVTDMPTGWVLDMSRIAPAFGRNGGGINLRFLDDIGKDVSVTELRDLGILTHVGS
jgi:hypothetical protein